MTFPSYKTQLDDFYVLICSLMSGQQIHDLSLNLQFENEQMHACFCGKKIIQKKQRIVKPEKKQNDAFWSSGFLCLNYF